MHDNIDEYRKFQIDKPLNPHMTNTNSTISNEMPSIGKDKPPPEFVSSVDGNFSPKDSIPENIKRMTGGTQKAESENGAMKELDVGELEDVSFKVDPIKRTGEDANTMRARLLCLSLHRLPRVSRNADMIVSLDQSRKRGTLESDLLLSTFADANLARMSQAQLATYDRFLDENDWDIYYWVTQEPTPTSMEYAEGGKPEFATPVAQGKAPEDIKEKPRGWMETSSDEWAQTVGRNKPAYRPVPARWKNSEILSLLKKHVKQRSAGSIHDFDITEGQTQPAQETRGGGLGRMPNVRNFDM